MSHKNIALVTGGAGFIGSHLVDLLIDSGYQVRVIDNLFSGNLDNLQNWRGCTDLEISNEDIRKIDLSSSIFKDVKYFFHLAGIGEIVPSIEQPINYMDINVQGTVRMLEASRLNCINKFIYAASSSCYGLAETPTNENHKIEPMYPYALSKYLGELATFHWGKVYGVKINSICIFNAYGPRVRTQGAYGAVFGVFLKQKLVGKPLTIVGDGSQSRDFVYVTDVAKSFLAAAEKPIFGERFNVGGGRPQSITQLANLIGGEIAYIPRRPGEPKATHADISKAKLLLDWSPVVDFEYGVREMMKNISAWENAPLWDENSIAEATKSWFRYLGNNEF